MLKNKWFFITLFFILGIIAGCGRDASMNHNGNEGTSKIEKEQIEKAPFHIVIETKEKNDSIAVSYKLKNISAQAQTLTFTSGLQTDYILYDEAGNKIEQYSDIHSSTQAMIDKTLEKEEEFENEFTITDVPKGRYVIEVFVPSNKEYTRAVINVIVEKSDIIKGNGLVIGQIDPHTIEIQQDGIVLAYQLTGKALNESTLLKEGEKITFLYTENSNQQKIIKKYFKNSQKITLTKSVLELEQNLVDAQAVLKENKDPSSLSGFSPFEIFQLYMYTKAGEDFETLYYFHSFKNDPMTLESFKQENMASEAIQDNRSFMIKLNEVRNFDVLFIEENRVNVVFTLPGEKEPMEFKMIKEADSLWKAMWPAFQ